MALVEQSQSGQAFSSLLAPFTGVDNATARVLKAISALELAALRDGDIVYVESVRDYWKWVPTSTATDDSTGAAAQLRYCNPTVNGANPGRFERLFICSPDWLTQNFFIDTGAAGHNENSGATALLPLNNDSELYQRWGGNAKIASQLTITYAQTPTVPSNIWAQLMPNGSITFLGTPTVTKPAVVITAVTAQVRTAGAEVAFSITGVGLGAADVGNLAIITASVVPANIGAYARVLKDNGGGSVRMTTFGTFIPIDSTPTFNPFVLVTPVVGDTIQIISLSTTLPVARHHFVLGSQVDALDTPARNCIIYDTLTVNGLTPAANGSVHSDHVSTFYARCFCTNLGIAGIVGLETFHRFCGGGASVINIRAGSLLDLRQTGVTGTITVNQGASIVVRVDTFFQNGSLTFNAGGSGISSGMTFWDRSVASTALFIQPGARLQQTGAVPDWGTANAGFGLRVQSGGLYSYVTKPTINGTLGAGREAQVGGTDKLYAAIPYVEGANNAALVLTA